MNSSRLQGRSTPEIYGVKEANYDNVLAAGDRGAGPQRLCLRDNFLSDNIGSSARYNPGLCGSGPVTWFRGGQVWLRVQHTKTLSTKTGPLQGTKTLGARGPV